MSRAEMKALAKQSIKGYIATAFLIAFIIVLLSVPVLGVSAIIPFASIIIGLLILGPFALGSSIFYLNIVRGIQGKVGDVFKGFQQFVPSFVLMLMRSVFMRDKGCFL